MNDTTSVFKDRDELVKDADKFPVDFAAAGTLGLFDRLTVMAKGKEAKIEGSIDESSKGLASLNVVAPEMGQLLDEQIRRWMIDLKNSPMNIYLLNNIGNAYLGRGNIDEAIKYFRSALETDKTFITARKNLAKSYIMLGKLDDASSIYLTDVKVHPNDTKIMMNLAHIYLRQGKLNDARDILDEILRLDPANVAGHHNRGTMYLVEGKVDRALSEFRKSIAIDVRFAPAYNALGVCYSLMGNHNKAIKYLQVSQAIDSSVISTTRNLATVYSLKGDFVAAAKLTEEFLSKYPMDWQARNIAALSYFKREDYRRCLSHLEYLLSNAETIPLNRTQTSIIRNNTAVVLQKMGLVSEAEKMYRESIAISETPNPIVYFNLARLYIDLKAQKKAKLLLDEYKSISPDDDKPLILLARYHCNQDEYDKAQELLIKALEMNPNSKDAIQLLSFVYAEGLGDHDRAIQVLNSGLVLDPQYETFLNNLAYSYIKKGLLPEARNSLDQIHWEKAHFISYATKGLMRIYEGKIREGSSLYDTAANLAPNQEWKALVRQKKRIEIARFWATHNRQGEAVRLLQSVAKIKTRTQLYLKQADKLLAQLLSS